MNFLDLLGEVFRADIPVQRINRPLDPLQSTLLPLPSDLPACYRDPSLLESHQVRIGMSNQELLLSFGLASITLQRMSLGLLMIGYCID